MGRGDRKKIRWKKSRQKKKLERLKRKAEAKGAERN